MLSEDRYNDKRIGYGQAMRAKRSALRHAAPYAAAALLLLSGCTPYEEYTYVPAHTSRTSRRSTGSGKITAGKYEVSGNTPIEKTTADMVNKLAELGVESLTSDSAVIVDSMFKDADEHTRITEFLYWSGHGIYQADTSGSTEYWKFTPNSYDVYSMDLEYKGASNIYTMYLNGLASISGGEYRITDIKEDMKAIKKSGTGFASRKITFRLNGVKYYYTTSESDSLKGAFETDIFNFTNDIFLEQGFEKRLYFLNYNNIGCIMFFASPDWAKKFKKETGLALSDRF